MRNLAKILLVASMISSGTLYANEDPIVAKYKGGEIKESQIFELIKPRLEMDPNFKGKTFSDLDKASQENLIRQFAIGKLIEQEAKSSGIENTKEFTTKLENAKTGILQSEYIEQNVKKAVTDNLINSKVDEIKKSVEGKNEVKISHILVEKTTPEVAKDVKKQLDAKTAKFEDLAKKFSQDKGSKGQGGKLDKYLREGSGLPKEIEDQVFKMKKGQISNVIETDYGLHIIRVDDVRKIHVTDDEVKQQAIQAANANAINQIVDDLTKKYDLQIIPVEPKHPKAEDKHAESDDKKTESDKTAANKKAEAEKHSDKKVEAEKHSEKKADTAKAEQKAEEKK